MTVKATAMLLSCMRYDDDDDDDAAYTLLYTYTVYVHKYSHVSSAKRVSPTVMRVSHHQSLKILSVRVGLIHFIGMAVWKECIGIYIYVHIHNSI